jgi:uncharacterized membrane protein
MTKSNSTITKGTPLSDAPAQEPVLERLTIWPHRSLSKKGFAIFMAILGGLLFAIGLGFFLAGAWPVIGFLGLELLVVWGAFKLNYRAARRRETIETTTDSITVQKTTVDGTSKTVNFPLGWLRVRLSPEKQPDPETGQQQRVYLTSHGVETEIGAFLHPAEKPALKQEVHKMVSRSRNMRDKTA